MEWILILLVLGFAALVILKGVAANVGGDTDSQSSLAYRKKKTLFTEAERSFLGVLDQSIDSSKYRIFGKVRVADILEPNPSKNRSEWQKAFNPIKAKHFDYVICAADTLKPVCAIELDDKSHSQKKRQQRDQLLESVCKDASLPLIRVPAKRSYKLEEVKSIISKCVGIAEKVRECSFTREVLPKNGKGTVLQLEKKVKPNIARKPELLKVENTDLRVGEISGAIRE